jgi:hypothetical protein
VIVGEFVRKEMAVVSTTAAGRVSDLGILDDVINAGFRP